MKSPYANSNENWEKVLKAYGFDSSSSGVMFILKEKL